MRPGYRKPLVALTTTLILTYILLRCLQKPHRPPRPVDSQLLNGPAPSAVQSDIRLIYAATESYQDFDRLDFGHCEYTNCISAKNVGRLLPLDADVVIFEYTRFSSLPRIDWRVRQNQLWILFTEESYGAWIPAVNEQFNATMTFRRDSRLVLPYAKAVKTPGSGSVSRRVNYAAGKTKGAFAYVSNCKVENYDRLGLMRRLREFVDVDIFGYCVGSKPCPRRFDTSCESREHGAYRFYLSFENALYRDYITEKFWSRLRAPGHFLPVAMGGAGLSDYTRVAPPGSFLHVYNYSGVEELGRHMRRLMSDDEEYNSYHEWRERYRIEDWPLGDISCQLCELANTKPHLPAKTNLTDWWAAGLTGAPSTEVN